MNDIAQVINNIAIQLGVGVKGLYPYAVNNIIIQGWELIITTMLTIIGFLFSLKSAIKDDWNNTTLIVLVMVLGMVSGGLLIATLSVGIPYLFNPEFYAVRSIVRMAIVQK